MYLYSLSQFLYTSNYHSHVSSDKISNNSMRIKIGGVWLPTSQEPSLTMSLYSLSQFLYTSNYHSHVKFRQDIQQLYENINRGSVATYLSRALPNNVFILFITVSLHIQLSQSCKVQTRYPTSL